MNNTFAYQVLNDFNLMNKIIKQKHAICREIGKKIMNNFSYYLKQRYELTVKYIEEYFKKIITPKIRALSWKNIHRVQLYVDLDYGDCGKYGCVEWYHYNHNDQWNDGGFHSYEEYKNMLDRTISEMKKDIDDGLFLYDITDNMIWRKSGNKLKDDPEYQRAIYLNFTEYEFDFDAEITIIKKSHRLKKFNGVKNIDLDL